MHRAIALPALVLTAALAGCSTTGGTTAARPRAVSAPTEAQQAALLDQIKTLAGEWEMVDDPTNRTVFAVSSAGSVVREIMFPGDAHEMTNVYHMDGPDMLMTHYCAAGNQARMRAKAGGQPGRIEFNFDDVTNLHDPNGHYMGQMTLVMLDPDHIRQEWRSYDKGQLMPEPAVFDFRRKR